MEVLELYSLTSQMVPSQSWDKEISESKDIISFQAFLQYYFRCYGYQRIGNCLAYDHRDSGEDLMGWRVLPFKITEQRSPGLMS